MAFDLSRCPQTESEARDWYFKGIGRAINGPADDYEAVMSAAGLPPGYGPGVVPDASMPYFAFTNMVGSDGTSRGRIFLPTKYPDDENYFTRQIQVIADGPTMGSLVWAWSYISGQQYHPVQGAEGGGSGGGGGESEGDYYELEQRVTTLEQRYTALEERVTALEGSSLNLNGQTVCLRAKANGKWLRVTMEEPLPDGSGHPVKANAPDSQSYEEFEILVR